MIKIYMVIVYIHFLNQIVDNKNINGSVKGANYNQICMLGNFKLLAYVSVLFMIRKLIFVITDFPLLVIILTKLS